MGDPRFQVVHFFIKWTFHLCDICVCLIPRKCYLEIWDHSLNPNCFSTVNFPPSKKSTHKKKKKRGKKHQEITRQSMKKVEEKSQTFKIYLKLIAL